MAITYPVLSCPQVNLLTKRVVNTLTLARSVQAGPTLPLGQV